jgi:hypothetical protein
MGPAALLSALLALGRPPDSRLPGEPARFPQAIRCAGGRLDPLGLGTERRRPHDARGLQVALIPSKPGDRRGFPLGGLAPSLGLLRGTSGLDLAVDAWPWGHVLASRVTCRRSAADVRRPCSRAWARTGSKKAWAMWPARRRPGFSRTLSGPRWDRPWAGRRTSGTGDCSRSAPFPFADNGWRDGRIPG